MVDLIINNFIESEHKPIGDVQDFFTGLNFSSSVLCTYIHCFGLKMHPVYGKNSYSEVASFVEYYVSCSDDIQHIEPDFLNLQLHTHAKTCKKNGKNPCIQLA